MFNREKELKKQREQFERENIIYHIEKKKNPDYKIVYANTGLID